GRRGSTCKSGGSRFRQTVSQMIPSLGQLERLGRAILKVDRGSLLSELAVRVERGFRQRQIDRRAAAGRECHGHLGPVGLVGETGLTPIILGAVLLVLAILFSNSAAKIFAIIPVGGVGALLILAGMDLAVSRRLFDARMSCWPVIGVAALVTLLVNPAL